jgi:hypothetical protein
MPDSNGAYDGERPIMAGPISVGPSQLGGAEGKEGKASKPVDRSKGLWTRCDKCGVILYIKHLKEHHHICFGCNYHLKMTSQERIDHLIDPGASGARARGRGRGALPCVLWRRPRRVAPAPLRHC